MAMMNLRRKLMDKCYVPPYTLCEQTGNPVMFSANVQREMNISISPTQSGEANVYVSGTNIWDEEWVAGLLNSDGTVSSGSRITSKNFIPVKPGETYVMVWPRGVNRGSGAYYDADGDLVQYCADFPDEEKGVSSYQYGNFTVPSTACFLKFCANGSCGSTYNDNISINYPTNDIAYHAYNGAKYETTFPVNNAMSVYGPNVVQTDLSGDMTVQFYCHDPSESKLVVMTYNVQYFSGLNEDMDMQEDILDEYSPSIIGLQEYRSYMSQKSTEAALTDRYWNMSVGFQTLPTALATNYGLSNVAFHLFENQVSGENKGYNSCEFKFKGKTVFWINTHLTDGNSTVKIAQIGELLTLVQTKESFIITGDLNTYCKSKSDSEYTTMIKPFIDAGYNVANCSDQHGFIDTWTNGKDTTGTWYPHDNIITSADFTMSNVRRDTTKITEAAIQDKIIDHVPLICELTL